MDNTTAGFWLSPQQKHLWTLQQRGGNFATVSLIAGDGPLQVDRLQRAFEHVATRHDILRTVYRRQSGMKVPFQVILDGLRPVFETARPERVGGIWPRGRN